MQTVSRALNGFMAAVFLFAAALQHSSSNPFGWMSMYIALAIPCIMAIQGRLVWQVPAIVASIGIMWIIYLAMTGVLSNSLQPLTSGSPAEAHEALGAIVGTTWMITLTILSLRGRFAGAPIFASDARGVAYR